MPNWKKVVVSGSKAHLAEVTASTMKATGAITAGSYVGDGSSLSGVNNFSITNPSASRVLTSNADGTGASAETEIYIDGSFIRMQEKTLYGHTSTGFTYDASSNDVTQGFRAGVSSNDAYGSFVILKNNAGSTKVEISAGGRQSYIATGSFGLGTSAPDTILEVAGAPALPGGESAPNEKGLVHLDSSTKAFIALDANNDDSGLYFQSGNTSQYYLYYDKSAEHLKIGSGSKFISIDKEQGHITASGIISASGNIYADEFHGDGSNLTGVTAGSVTWGNVSSKPTVVSGSGQIAGGSISQNTMTVGGVLLTLNGTDSTPAFDLSDATGYTGDSSLVTTGTVTSGVWRGTAIDSAYLDSDTAHLSTTQTFSGAKSFTLAVNIDASTNSTSPTTGALIVDGGVGVLKNIYAGGNIVTEGDIIAKNYIVSSSVTHMTQSFQSGSTIFGDGSADTHQFTGSLLVSGSITPGGDAVFNLGSSTKRWRNVYSGDIHLSNENTDGNAIDGTNGNWTIQEGSEDLYLLNNKNGKKYKFKLEEIK